MGVTTRILLERAFNRDTDEFTPADLRNIAHLLREVVNEDETSQHQMLANLSVSAGAAISALVSAARQIALHQKPQPKPSEPTPERKVCAYENDAWWVDWKAPANEVIACVNQNLAEHGLKFEEITTNEDVYSFYLTGEDGDSEEQAKFREAQELYKRVIAIRDAYARCQGTDEEPLWLEKDHAEQWFQELVDSITGPR